MDYNALFQRLYPSLFQYIVKLTGDSDVAEDVAQETFVRLLKQSIPEAEIRPWLFTVATNLVRDGARKTERRGRLVTGIPAPIPMTGPAADERLERAETIEAVRAVLRQMPDRDRQLLLMREEGFRYDEIAAAVGVAPASVGTLIARALKRFARLYRANGANVGDRDDDTYQ